VSTPRYAPAREFPRSAFVPGRTARPEREKSVVRASIDAERWREDDDYLFGVDLYNSGFLWEAHEAWERPWRASADELQRLYLQGLIQCAAACLRLAMEESRGAPRLARAAGEKLERVARRAPDGYMGLDVATFARDFAAFFAREPTTPARRPVIVLRVGRET
jgi:uncharacterized protein